MVVEIPKFSDFKSLQQYTSALDTRAQKCMILANKCIKINVLHNRGTDVHSAVDIVCDNDERDDIQKMMSEYRDPISVAGYFITTAKLLNELLDAVSGDMATA